MIYKFNNKKFTFPCESLLPMSLNSDIWKEDFEGDDEEEERKKGRLWRKRRNIIGKTYS